MATNQGKTAEAKVAARLSALCTSAQRVFYRLPDAHAGSRAPTLCDYIFMDNGQLFVIEVKETSHDFRLPYGNFGPDQVARMRLWTMAGAKGLVLIHHSKLKLWRGYPLERFIQRDKDAGSWLLTDTEPQKLEALLD